jgi:hypothetical protein
VGCTELLLFPLPVDGLLGAFGHHPKCSFHLSIPKKPQNTLTLYKFYQLDSFFIHMLKDFFAFGFFTLTLYKFHYKVSYFFFATMIKIVVLETTHKRGEGERDIGQVRDSYSYCSIYMVYLQNLFFFFFLHVRTKGEREIQLVTPAS